MLNMALLAMMNEAAKPSDPDTPEDTDAQTDTGTGENPDTEGVDDTGTEDGEPSEEENPEEGNDDDTDPENPDDGTGDDDFSMDPDGGEDDEPPPDGLVDPDDDGSGDEPEDDVETNVQTTILQVSQLDRTLLKRKCYNDYQDLRSSITSFKNVLNDNEASIEPEIRDYAIDQLGQLFNNATDYLKYKFMVNNYEENLKNYAVLVAAMNSIVEYVKNGGDKPARKLTVKKTTPKKPKAKKKPEPKPEEPEEPEDTGTEPEEPEPPEEEEPEEPE